MQQETYSKNQCIFNTLVIFTSSLSLCSKFNREQSLSSLLSNASNTGKPRLKVAQNQYCSLVYCIFFGTFFAKEKDLTTPPRERQTKIRLCYRQRQKLWQVSGDVLNKLSLALSTCESIPVQIHLKLIPCTIASWLVVWLPCILLYSWQRQR